MSTARRFFFGGSRTSSLGGGTEAASPSSSTSPASTLVAGVSGGSALRFPSTLPLAGAESGSGRGAGRGVTGDMAGRPTACMEGVERGVAIVEDAPGCEFVSGRAW